MKPNWQRITAFIFGMGGFIGFVLCPFAAVEASIYRHQNPEAIIGPMWIAMLSLLFSLIAWRLSDLKRYATIASIGTAASVLAVVIAAFWK